MAAVQQVTLDSLLTNLHKLCALRSIAGDERALAESAAALASLLQQFGFQVTLIETAGAPVVLAERAGRLPRRVLFYDHYDVAPSGPWSAWHHEPFAAAERDGIAYGRGVVTKGNLVARLGAIASLLEAQGELPIGVSLLVEGEALLGSPHLPDAVANYADHIWSDLVVGHSGMIASSGLPYLYAGVKGRLQLRMRAHGASMPLPAEAAAGLPSPVWRLLWALASLKSDSEEVLVEGFYDEVEPVSRETLRLARSIDLDEQARLQAWGLDHFLFDLSGAALARAEIFNPTLNLSFFTAGQGHLPTLPSSAAALLDFALVPNQRPASVVELIRNHLQEKEFTDIEIEALPGAYPAARTPLDNPLLERVAATVEQVYGSRPPIVPLAQFCLPLHLFTAAMRAPAVVLGLVRPDSALRAPNEQLRVSDMQAMSRMIAQLLCDLGQE